VTASSIVAGELMARRSGTVDPKKHPDETFELHSIPAFDAGKPENLKGSAIGSAKQIVEPNDVMISKIVPHIRRASIVGASTGLRQIASGEWIVFRDERFHPPYLRHVLMSDRFHAEFMSTVSGVGGSLLRARPAEVSKIRIPLPPHPEQRRIAAILDKADALRAKRREAIAKLDQLLQSVFLEMFGDPVTNPMGWPTVSVDEVSNLVRGSSPRPQGDPRYFGGPVPRLMVADLTRDGMLVTPRIDSLTIEGAKKSRPAPAGSVVMAVSGNVGLASILAIDACIHDGFVGFLQLKQSLLLPQYLLMYLVAIKNTHQRITAGAIFQNMTTTDIKKLRIPSPPITLQQQFLRTQDRVAEQQSLVAKASTKLNSVIGALQSEFFIQAK
jgi:type I restriction enzyme S subunit